MDDKKFIKYLGRQLIYQVLPFTFNRRIISPIKTKNKTKLMDNFSLLVYYFFMFRKFNQPLTGKLKMVGTLYYYKCTLKMDYAQSL